MPARIIMLYGYTGTGKSTVAEKLSEKLDSMGIDNSVIRTDEIRSTGATMTHSSDEQFDDKIEDFKKERDRVYRKIVTEAERKIARGVTAILDASFSRIHRREWVYSLAEKMNIDIYIIWCDCDDENEIRKRLTMRYLKNREADDQASSFHVYRLVKGQAEKIEDHEVRRRGFKIIHFDNLRRKIEPLGCSEKEPLVKIIIDVCNSI